MRIQDASDRIYQGRIYKLLDEARSSIIISMYLIRPGDDPKHPVNRLLQDLVDARKRKVQVTIYLNTKFKGQDPRKLIEGPWFDRLRKAGVEIKLVSPVRRLHDKLIIIDERFVVEGSTNWSVAAIADNLESATIIESRELAQTKLRRIGFFPIWGEEQKKIPAPPEELFPAGPPTSVEVPILFMDRREYFPKLITDQKERALKVFLLLLFIAQAKGAQNFTISPEAVGGYLGFLPARDRTAIRRQVVRTLRELGNLQRFIRLEFRHGKGTWIELHLPAGSVFTLSSEFLEAGELAALSDNAIFLRLIRARLFQEGKRLEDLSACDIKKRFFVDSDTLKRATN